MFKITNMSGQSISITIIRDGVLDDEFLGTEAKNLTCISESVTPELLNLENLGIIKIREISEDVK